jgi:hypothetical protein
VRRKVFPVTPTIFCSSCCLLSHLCYHTSPLSTDFELQRIMCQETPVVKKTLKSNPFEFLPVAPKHNSRVDKEKRQRIMDNLEILCAPSFTSTEYESSTECERRTYQIDSPRTLKFNFALERMRQGDALRRLRKLQEEEQACSGESPAEKSGSSLRQSILDFGRRIPERKRSFARTA